MHITCFKKPNLHFWLDFGFLSFGNVQRKHAYKIFTRFFGWDFFSLNPQLIDNSWYIPGTSLSSILGLQPSKRRPFPFKTTVIWVPGIYGYISCCVQRRSMKPVPQSSLLPSNIFNQPFLKVSKSILKDRSIISDFQQIFWSENLR